MQNKYYDRTVCNECNFKETCVEYRNKFWCKDCPQSFLCFAKDKDCNDYCAYKKQNWEQLPSTCLLFNELLQQYFKDPKNKDSFIMKGGWVCPRCLYKTLIVFERPEGTYNGWCYVCGASKHF